MILSLDPGVNRKLLKELSPIFLNFFSNFWYHKKVHIFLIAHGKCYS